MLHQMASNNYLLFVCIGIIAGWIVGEFRQGEGYGIAGNAVIGILGAIVGGFMSEYLDLMQSIEVNFPLVVQPAVSAIIGSGVLLFCLDRLGVKT
ncbi:MAG: GlsB/YeaQ/YmgE family stress response membrane protein [Planctomycetaceae bacterium]|nr:GlsB/YeaQ/YmgE family stress response membrane protein [Planctomycetaceae bacterium]